MGLDGSGTSPVRWSDYKRKTGANEVFADVNGTADEKEAATAIVPDAHENRNCGVDGQGISSGNNHKVSSLRNMIKRYDVSYTGGSTSEKNIGAGGAIPSSTTWDENLDLNIPKRLTLDSSSWKASQRTAYALKFNDPALNLELKFNGTKVYGKEGAGGAAGGGNGQSGGGALYLRNNTSKSTGESSKIKLNLTNNALIAGGGGGGGGGNQGNTSGTTTCTVTNTHTNTGSQNNWRTGCPSTCACNHGGGRYFRGRGQYAQGVIYYSSWSWTCTNTRSTSTDYNAPSRRSGGAGGVGRGSNNTGGAGGGQAGQAAAYTNCSSGTQSGTATANAGGTGASGGGYGAAGGNAGGNGGAGGKWLNVGNTRWAHIGASSNTILKGGVG